MALKIYKNATIFTGEVVEIVVDGAEIVSVGMTQNREGQFIDLKRALVLPGVIDPHVHVRDMGLKEKETWASASYAAAAGGITTIFDMPNTVPPTIDQFGLTEKRNSAKNSVVNWGIHFGATPSNESEIRKANNIGAIKLFLARSSSAFPIPDRAETRKIFEICADLGKPVIVHSECQACVDEYAGKIEHDILNHNKIRNPECAIKSSKMILELAEEVGNILYIAHISTREELDMVRRSKDKGVKLFVEATPHHLLLSEEVLHRAGNFGKVNPPIRNKADRDALWEALVDGTVDTLGTDHAPHQRSEKMREYDLAPSGFPGLETALPLLLSEVNKNRLSISRLQQLTSENPARIFTIEKRGKLLPGNIADFTVVDMNSRWQVDAEKFHTKAKYSPFQNTELSATILRTIVNGQEVFADSKINHNSRGAEVEYA